MDMAKRVPGWIDREAAKARLIEIEIRSPAHYDLTGMKDNAVEHAPSATDSTFINMADERK